MAKRLKLLLTKTRKQGSSAPDSWLNYIRSVKGPVASISPPAQSYLAQARRPLAMIESLWCFVHDQVEFFCKRAVALDIEHERVAREVMSVSECVLAVQIGVIAAQVDRIRPYLCRSVRVGYCGVGSLLSWNSLYPRRIASSNILTRYSFSEY